MDADPADDHLGRARDIVAAAGRRGRRVLAPRRGIASVDRGGVAVVAGHIRVAADDGPVADGSDVVRAGAAIVALCLAGGQARVRNMAALTANNGVNGTGVVVVAVERRAVARPTAAPELTRVHGRRAHDTAVVDADHRRGGPRRPFASVGRLHMAVGVDYALDWLGRVAPRDGERLLSAVGARGKAGARGEVDRDRDARGARVSLVTLRTLGAGRTRGAGGPGFTRGAGRTRGSGRTSGSSLALQTLRPGVALRTLRPDGAGGPGRAGGALGAVLAILARLTLGARVAGKTGTSVNGESEGREGHETKNLAHDVSM